ncbi:MAG TPA: hypothetical protein VK174_09705 [Chitinophagales bacterium]|nr:hypothetical protein [Chitinophagales bacterium]
MLTKALSSLLLVLLLSACKRDNKLPALINDAVPLSYRNFNLKYLSTGWGSNTGMTLTLKAEGTKGLYDNDGDTVSITLDTKTIDSIISLTNFGQSRLIVKSDPKAKGTGFHYLQVASDSGIVEYKLRYASDSTAIKVIDILNNSIPTSRQKLWLVNHVTL